MSTKVGVFEGQCKDITRAVYAIFKAYVSRVVHSVSMHTYGSYCFGFPASYFKACFQGCSRVVPSVSMCLYGSYCLGFQSGLCNFQGICFLGCA